MFVSLRLPAYGFLFSFTDVDTALYVFITSFFPIERPRCEDEEVCLSLP